MKLCFDKTLITLALFALVICLLVDSVSAAVVITQWSFPASVSQGTTAKANSPAPSYGSGTAITLGMTNNYNGGNVAGDDVTSTAGLGTVPFTENAWRIRGDGGQKPPEGANGWALYNSNGPGSASGAPEYSQGIQLDTSTVGYSNVSFSFDWYSTTQGIRDLQFQYCLNTTNSAASGYNNWVNMNNTLAASVTAPDGLGAIQTSNTAGYALTGSTISQAGSYVFVATPNDWYGGQGVTPTITVNLNSVAGAANDPYLGIRLVSAFDSTGALNDYASATLLSGATGGTQLYNNSSGNWRFGDLTFAGNLSLSTNFAGSALIWSKTSGTWDTASSNWSGSTTVYSDSNTFSASFGAVTGGTSTITVQSGGVTPTGVAISNPNVGTGYAFVGGAIGGTGALYLTPTNFGFVSLSGTNTYTGGTQVSGGTLIVAGDSSLGVAGNNGTGAVVLDGGATLQLASSLTTGRLLEIGNSVGGGGGVFNTNGLSASTSGNVLSNGNFTVAGGGSLALNGFSTQLSGSTTVTTGTTLVLGGTNVAAFQGGGTINGNIIIAAPERVNFDNGIYNGSGAVEVSYSGTIAAASSAANNLGNASNIWAVLSNTSTGSATANGGTVTSGGTISSNIILNPNNLSFTKSNVAGTTFSGTKSATYTFSLPFSNYFIAGIGATTPGNTLTISGNISGQSDIVLGSNSNVGSGGGGTLFLSGSNSWAGTTMIDGNNTIQLGSSKALPTNTDVIFGPNDKSGATLDLNGNSVTINTLSVYSGSPIVTNSNLSSSATLTISGGTTAANPYSGLITGNLAIVKNGLGTVTFTGSNTYTGNTSVTNGVMVVGGTSPLGVGALAVGTSATLQTSGASVVLANSLTTLNGTAALKINGGTSYGTLGVASLTLGASNSLSFLTTTTQDDEIFGSGALTLPGSGTITINLRQTGTIFSSYPLFSFGSVSGFTGTTFNVTGGSAGYVYTVVQNGSNSDEIDVNVTNGVTFNAQTWAASSGSWDQINVGNWNNGPYVDGEPVSFNNPSGASTITIASSGATPQSVAINNSSNSYTFAGGPINGTTGITKTGVGNATFATSNSYTGGTTITGGSLTIAAGDLSLGNASGLVTIDGGASLVTTTTAVKSSRSFNVGTISGVGGTYNTAGQSDSISGTVTIGTGATFTVSGGGTLAVAQSKGVLTANTGSSIAVLPNTSLSILADNITSVGNGVANNIAFNIAAGANVFLTSAVASTATSTVFEQAYGGTYNGHLVVQNPLTLSFASGSYSGTIQFQSASMQTPAGETHFSAASGALIQADNVNLVTLYNQTIGANIQLDSDSMPFYRTSISQSGAIAGGTGFQLGNGTTASVLFIDPASPAGNPNTLTINGVISGSGDVQFGPIGGGGQGGTVVLNAQNTYSGVTMLEFGTGGVIQLGTSNALPKTTDVMFAPVSGNSYQANIDLNGNNQTVNSISYWAYGSAANEGIVNNAAGTATLTVSGTSTPARPYLGILNDGTFGKLALVKAGSNALVLTGSNNGYSGGTTLQGGLLLLAPGSSSINSLGIYGVVVTGGTLQGTAQIGFNAYSSAYQNLDVYAGGTVHPGLASIPSIVPSGALASGIFPAQVPGTLSVLGSASFASGSNLIYDIASSSSQSLLTVNGALGLPTSGTITLTIGTSSGLTLGTPVPLIEYSGGLANGNSLSSIGSLFKVANAASYFPDYTLAVTGATAGVIDLTEVRNTPLWTGSSGSVWSTTAANFSSGGSPTKFYNGDAVTFSDSSSTGSISISGSVAPGSVTFSNSSEAYSITGGAITGTGGLYVNGNGVVTLANTNTYTGETNVSSGTLVLDGAASLLAGNSLLIGGGAGGSPFAALPSAVVSPVNAPSAQGSPSLAPVPEPGTFALLAVAALGGIGYVWRKCRTRQAS
jgi:autotransporter-associated beta strand protein